MTLRVRLAAFVAAAVGIAVVVVAFAAYRSTSQETIAGIDRFLRNRELPLPVSSTDRGRDRARDPGQAADRGMAAGLGAWSPMTSSPRSCLPTAP